jgi:hypothetical protein
VKTVAIEVFFVSSKARGQEAVKLFYYLRKASTHSLNKKEKQLVYFLSMCPQSTAGSGVIMLIFISFLHTII